MNLRALAAATTVAAVLLPAASHAAPPPPDIPMLKALDCPDQRETCIDICYIYFDDLTGEWYWVCIPWDH